MTKVQYLNTLPGRDKKLGCDVIRNGIYECTEEIAQSLIKSGQYKIVEEEKKVVTDKKVKNKY